MQMHFVCMPDWPSTIPYSDFLIDNIALSVGAGISDAGPRIACVDQEESTHFREDSAVPPGASLRTCQCVAELLLSREQKKEAENMPIVMSQLVELVSSLTTSEQAHLRWRW